MNEQFVTKINDALKSPDRLSKKEIISLLSQSQMVITSYAMENLRLRAVNNSLLKQKESSL